jgi:hypothetical protein
VWAVFVSGRIVRLPEVEQAKASAGGWIRRGVPAHRLDFALVPILLPDSP